MLLRELFEPRHVEWVVERLTRQYAMTPQQINNGWCWAFAVKLAKRLGGSARVINTTKLPGVFPGHSVVLYQGRYYDAESPSGVVDPRDLEYSKRLGRIRDGEEESSPEVLAMEPDPRA